jgi:hypothetical protein
MLRCEVEDAFDGDAAQGERLGEFCVRGGEAGEIRAEPLGEDFHDLSKPTLN